MSYKIYRNVKKGRAVHIGDFAVVGLPCPGDPEGESKTVIEDGVHIGSHSIVYAGTRIGRNSRCGHGTVNGDNSAIGHECG